MTFAARLRPSPAMVVALVALSVALGGVGYAASVLPASSVGTTQLKNNAVTAAKVKNGSLLAADFKAGQLPAGPAGVAGAPGAPGPAGVPGAPGEAFGKLTYVSSGVIAQPANGQGFGTATCPPGQRPVGGGVVTESPVAGEQQINSSFPSSSALNGPIDSWSAFVDKASPTALGFEIIAVCAPATNVTQNFARALR